MIEKGYYSEKGSVSEDVYDKIAAGVMASDETRTRIINYALDNGICD